MIQIRINKVIISKEYLSFGAFLFWDHYFGFVGLKIFCCGQCSGQTVYKVQKRGEVLQYKIFQENHKANPC